MQIKTNKDQLLIGLLSDTHIPSRVPKIPPHIIDDFKKRDIDYLFHLGDFTEINSLKYLYNEFGKENVIAIHGNMDGAELKNVLPETLELELYDKKIFLTHGQGGPNMIIRRLNKLYNLAKYDIIIFGHVHRPYNEVWKDGKLYLNPGTPTDKRFTNINSYGYLLASKEKFIPEIIIL
ncbi:MAG: metallophosphoesterase family protein [Promethearchaeota archaeon]